MVIFGWMVASLCQGAPLGTGGIDIWKDRPWKPYELPKTAKTRDMPSRLVHHEYLPTVRSQGAEPSCHYWALVYYYRTWQEAKEQGWVHPDVNTHPEQVMYHGFSYKLQQPDLVSGCISYADMEGGFNEWGWPTREQWEAALPHRFSHFEGINLQEEDALAQVKAHLNTGDLAYFALNLEHNFVYVYPQNGDGIDNEVLYRMVGDPYDPPGDESTSLHALTLIGYDDSKSYNADGEQKQGAFLAVNSWGADFGVSVPEVGTGGFVWLGYDFFLNYVEGRTLTIMVDQPTVKPTDLVVLEMDHGRMLEITATLYGGDPDSPEWETILPLPSGNFSCKSRMVFDISDFPITQTGAFSLRVSDMDVGMIPNMMPPTYIGTVDYFAIERSDSETPWECQETPVSTVDRQPADGDPDKYLWLEASLFEKREEAFALPELGMGDLVAGHFNDDNWPDLLVTSRYFYGEYMTRLLMNDGAGNFAAKSAGLPDKSGPMASADLNGDGWLDLVLAPKYESQILFYAFSPAQESFVPFGSGLPMTECANLQCLDFNRDGHTDIAALNNYYEEGQPMNLKIWLGDGAGNLSEWQHGITRTGSDDGNQMVWRDFNQDGWLDLALSISIMEDQGGWPYLNSYCQIYLNQQGQSFTEGWRYDHYEMQGLEGADFNADGWADLLLFEYDTTVLFLNDGAGGFTVTETNLPVCYQVNVDAADFDQDGLTDLALAGELRETDYLGFIGLCALYKNLGGGQFALYSGDTPDMDEGVARFVDVDLDGDLDWVIQGDTNSPESSGLHLFPAFEVYLNGAAQDTRLNRPNLPPTAPANLRAETSDGNLYLRWDRASDAVTPATTLNYHVRAESFSGWNDGISGAQNLNGPAANFMGGHLADGSLGLCLSPAPDKTLSFQVKTVDAGRMASEWSEPLRVAPASGTDRLDVNRDGQLDTADLTLVQRVRSGMETDAEKQARADVSGDGTADGLDRSLIAAELLNRESPEPDLVDTFTLGPDGGSYESENVKVQAPAGAFSETVEIRIFNNPLDVATGRDMVSPFYRLEGLPTDFAQPLTISLRLTEAASGTVAAAHGANVWRSEGQGVGRAIRLLPGGSTERDWHTFSLEPLFESDRRRTRSSSPRYQFESETNWLGLQTGITTLESEHFAIHYPLDASTDAVIDMADALEGAWANLHGEGGRGFAASRLPSGRMGIYVEEMESSFFGYASDWPGRNADSVHINVKEVQPGRAYAPTAIHEFMHLVAAGYPPQSISFSTAWDTYSLDEACAVWFEFDRYSVPTVFYDNMQAPLTGFVPGARNFFSPSDKVKQDHGYGMSSLVEYMANLRGKTTFPSQLWDNVRLDYSMPECVRRAAGEEDYFWYTDYLEALIQGKLIMNLTYEKARDMVEKRQYKLDEVSPGTMQEWEGYLPSLSGNLHMTHLNRDDLAPTAKLSIRMAKNDDLELSVLRMLAPTVNQPDQTVFLDRGYDSNNMWKLDVPIADLDHDQGYKILSLVTNRNGNPSAAKTYYNILTAVTENKDWAVPEYMVYGPYEQNYPVFKTNSQVSGPGLAQVQVLPLGQGIQMLQAMALGRAPAEYAISVQAAVSQGYWADPVTDTEYQVNGVKSYKMEYCTEIGESAGETPQVATSSDGSFQMPLSVTSSIVYGSVYVAYDVILVSSGKVYESLEQPVFTFFLIP